MVAFSSPMRLLLAIALAGSGFVELSTLEAQEVAVQVVTDAEYPRHNLEQCIANSYPALPDDEALSQVKSCLLEMGVFSEVSTVFADQTLQFSLTLKKRVNQISIEGIDRKAARILSRQIKLREGDWLDPNEVEKSRVALLPLLQQFGFYSPTITTRIEQSGSYPLVVVTFKVEAGYQSKITSVSFSKEPPEELRGVLDTIVNVATSEDASRDTINDLVRLIRTTVRAEGYLQALVELESITYQPLGGDVEVKLKTRWKEPLSFFFSGNSEFSETELLEPLRLETRSVPFSANAVQSFTRAIERKYRNSGYLDVDVSSQERDSEQARKLFDITIAEGRQLFISEIKFSGNTAFSSDQLLRKISSQTRGILPLRIWQKGEVIVDQLREDVASVEQYYKNQGYRDAVVEYAINRSEEAESCTVEFKVKEGKRYLINRVRLRWLGMRDLFEQHRNQGFEVLRYKTVIKDRAAFSNTAIQKEQQRITAFLLRSGFPNASVTTDYRSTTGTLFFKIKPGPFVTVGSIVFRGNLLTQEAALYREMQIKPGDIWDTEALLRSQQNLYNTGIFRSIRLKPSDGVIDQAQEDLRVDLVERNTGSLAGSLGFDTVDGVHVNTELAQRNFLGSGDRLSLTLDGYLRSQVEAGYARLQHVRRRLLETDASLVNELFGQFAVHFIDQFSYDRAGYRATLRHQLREDLALSTSLGGFSENVFDVDPRVIIGPMDESNQDLLDFAIGLDFDRRDSPNLPTHGYRSQLRTGVVHDITGTEVSLLDIKAQQSVFFKPLERLVWANNLRFQMVESFASERTVPLSRRLFLGGRESLRGYGRYSVSPRHTDGIAVGGDRTIDGTTELRLQTFDNIVLIGFFDFGVSYLDQAGSFDGDALSSNDFRYSPGIGFAYETPVGPLSFEYGFALDRDAVDDFGRFAVSIGSRF